MSKTKGFIDDDVLVCGLNAAGFTEACTVCNKANANRYAKYYRSLRVNGMKKFHSVRIFTYEQMAKHDKKVQKEAREAMRYVSY